MVDIETFKRDFKAKNAEIFFMLRSVQKDASGIELAAFRRAKLFKDYLGVEVTLITNQYQHDLLERCDDYKINSHVLNMYDYFQEINRAAEKPRRNIIEPMHEGWKVERIRNDLCICRRDGSLAMYCVFSPKTQRLSFINFFNEKQKKIRRDCYDLFGFLSCRQELELDTEREKEKFYYRPDGTVAIHEVYKLFRGKNTLKQMELINKEGKVIRTFTRLDAALAYWLPKIFSDKEKNYLVIGDRTPEYHKAYVYFNSANFNNIKIIHQLHSFHAYGNREPLTAPVKDNYEFLADEKIKADAIVALTEQQRNDIVTRCNLSNVFAIAHPLQNFSIKETKVNPFGVVMIGRIVPAKGHAKAIDAFKLVVDKIPQAQLFFYGAGPLQAELQAKIDKLNLSNSIMFKGFSENVAEVFSSAALSICTSDSEGFSLAVQESLQNNCPVVSFSCYYGPQDMIEDGVNGYLVPPDDIKAMADRIIKILTEPKLRERLSANCARSVEKFSPDIVANKWAKLFCELINK